jgi:hypothetical protein
MKSFSDRNAGVLYREHEGARDVLSVNVLKGRQSVVREKYRLAVAKALEHRPIEMPGRIDRIPAWTGDVAGMKNGRRKSSR